MPNGPRGYHQVKWATWLPRSHSLSRNDKGEGAASEALVLFLVALASFLKSCKLNSFSDSVNFFNTLGAVARTHVGGPAPPAGQPRHPRWLCDGRAARSPALWAWPGMFSGMFREICLILSPGNLRPGSIRPCRRRYLFPRLQREVPVHRPPKTAAEGRAGSLVFI